MIQIRSTLTAVLAGMALLCSAAPALSASAADIKAQIGETDADFGPKFTFNGKAFANQKAFIDSGARCSTRHVPDFEQKMLDASLNQWVAERAAAGKPPINSLWFWGGGVLPDHVVGTSLTLYSDDPLLHGLAGIGKLEHMPLDAFTDFNSDALVDLRLQRDPRALVDAWMLPAAAGAKSHEVMFDFADGPGFVLQAAQRWRFWRSPLGALVA